MSKLLRADFARLWKSKAFWLGMAVTFGIGLFATMMRYYDIISTPDYTYHMEDVLFANGMLMPVIAAAFVGLFVGTEYSDGTIRNKIIVGQRRTAIYFSNLVVCVTALFMMHLLYIAVVAGVGVPLAGGFAAPGRPLLKLAAASLATVAALSALFLLMSMLIHNKAVCSVAAVLLSVIMLIAAMTISNRLEEPEYYEAYAMTQQGDRAKCEAIQEKNPRYLEGTKREVYAFLHDFLPGGQMLQISGQNSEHLGKFPLYSAAIVVVSTACGVFFFRRKNLK